MTIEQKERSKQIQRWVTMFECAEKGFYFIESKQGKVQRMNQHCTISICKDGQYMLSNLYHHFKEADYGKTWSREIRDIWAYKNEPGAEEGMTMEDVIDASDPIIVTGDEKLWLDGFIYVFSEDGVMEKINCYEGNENDKPLTLNQIMDEFMKEIGRPGEEPDCPIYVMYDDCLSGWIYCYGNTSDGKWYRHGTTFGYA